MDVFTRPDKATMTPSETNTLCDYDLTSFKWLKYSLTLPYLPFFNNHKNIHGNTTGITTWRSTTIKRCS